MMTGVWCIIFLLCIVLTGGAVTLLLTAGTRRSLCELSGLTITLGSGAVGMLLLWISIAGIKPGRWLLLGLAAVALILILVRARQKRMPLLNLPSPLASIPNTLGLASMGLLIAAAIAYSIMTAVEFPLINWDAIVIWGFKAKVLYAAALSPRPWYFTDPRLSYSHLDYPLLLPMLQAGAYAVVGGVNEPLGKVVFPFLFTGQMLLIYTGVRQWLSRTPAMAICILTCGAPFVVELASSANADMALATFWAGAMIYLARWIEERGISDAIISALFITFAANTKNEGIAIAAIGLLGMCIVSFTAKSRRAAFIDTGIVAAVVITGLSVWILWRAGIPHTDENYLARFSWQTVETNRSRFPGVIIGFLRAMADLPSWGGLWLLLPISSVLGFKAFQITSVRFLWLMLVLHLGLYGLIYVITPWEVQELMKNSLYRLLMHVAPTAGLIVGAQLAAVLTETGIATVATSDRPKG